MDPNEFLLRLNSIRRGDSDIQVMARAQDYSCINADTALTILPNAGCNSRPMSARRGENRMI
jgi:hypothetical protein